MNRIFSARGRVAVSVLVTALLASLSAFYYFNAVPVRSWHVPEVSIVTPAEGEDVAGPVVISATYSVSNGHVHTMRTLIDGQLADSKPAGSQSGTYTFTWNSTTVSDGPHTIEVRAYTAAPPSDHFNKETITIHVSNALCRSDADCDDQDDHTQDTCANPGTPNAVCAHAPIACLNDAECNDSEPLTLDSCQNAGTIESLCVNTAIQCNNNADCNDSDTHTQDVCLNGGTVSAACQHNAITCLNDPECNDSNPITLDSCQNPGMASSACLNAPIACNTNADCSDSDAHTEDICQNGGSANALCQHNPIACLNETECNDSDPLTLDQCQNPGTTASSCSNTAIVCNTISDCDDSDPLTQDVCVNGGTAASSCAHDPLACNSSGDCDDGNAYTIDQCENPGTTSSVCTHAAIACLTNQDCDDSNPLTLDSCRNPGAANASCENTPIACNTNADCDDSDTQTTDLCTNGGTANAACSHVPVTVDPEPEPVDLILEITSPDDGLVINQTAITVTGMATPGAVLTINGNTSSLNSAGAFSSAVALSEGANTITIKCCLGGECLTETRAVTVDTQSPEILDATVEDGILYIGVRDNAGGTGLDASSLEVTIDGGAVSATYDATRKSLRIIPGDLTPGAHIAAVSVLDLAGNTAQRTVNVVFRPNAGLKIIFKKLPGRQVPDEGVESSAFIAPPLDQTAATGSISGETDSITSQTLESEPVISSASPSAWDFSTLAAPGDYTVEAQKFLDLFDGKIDRAPGAKLPPGLLKKLDCSKAPDGNPLTLEAAASYSGDIEAQVTVEQGIQVDEQSIEVKVDGAPVPYQYDESTQSITATADELKRGVHTVEVSAADTDGNTTIATTAFGVDPNVLQFTLENADNPGGTITVGQRFKVTLELDGDPGGTPWFILFNANYMSDPAPHLIGWIFEMNTVSQAPGSYLYDYTGWFYTSFDQNEEEASVIGAAIPLDAGATQFTTAAGTIQVENGYARPNINFIELSKYNSPDRSLQVGDSYVVQASGTQGIQQMFSVLLNIDTFIQASNPMDAAVLKNGYVPGDPMTLVDPMVEDPAYGSGHYIVVNHAVPLESALDVQGSPVRAIMSMVCSPTSGNVCDVGNVMYLGSAPVMNSVTLMNLSGSDPNAPFSNTARGFRVEVQGSIAPEHLANMYLVLANAAKVTAGVPLKKTPGQPLLDWTITNGFAEVSGQPGVYAAEGVIDGYIDDDGTLASEVVAIVSAAGFYEDAKSAPHAIEQQQPPVPAPDPTTIETIAGQTVGADNHVTSDQDTPVITGSAPENSLVTIYELDPEASDGTLTSAFAPSGEFVNGVGFFGDPMDDGQWEDRWNGYIDSYGTFSFSETDRLVMQAGPGSKARLFSIASSAPFGHGFTMSAQMEFPSGLNSAPQDMDLSIRYAGLVNTPDGNTYELSFNTSITPGQGAMTLRTGDDRGHSCESADYPLVAQDTPYALDMIYERAGLLTMRINGTDVIAACPVQPAPEGAKLQPVLTLNAGSAQSAITWRALTTDIPMPDGYKITGPALGIDGGPAYDFMGTGYGLFFNENSDPIFLDGNSVIPGIDGTKDIHAATVRLFDLMFADPPNTVVPVTIYSAGNEPSTDDQLKTIHDFLETLKNQGGITGYDVDAVGVALSAQPGGGFAPGPMSAQSMVCSYEPGTPPSLTWDSAQSIYIGSDSALEYQGRAYDAFVAWGQSQNSDAPNIIGPEGGPVWWADGSADISVGALCSPSQGWCATGYGIQELIDQLQGNVDPELHALAHGVLRAPVAPGEDYTLDQAALESAGLTPAKRLTCTGYGRTPIAIATTDNNGAYQATKDAPFAATGDHLLYAESADPATGRPISNSSIVTYTLEAGQGNPPVIVSIDNQPVANTPEGSDYTPRVCALSPDGAPVDFYVQKSGIPVLSGNAAIPDVNGYYCADLDSLLTNNDINSEGDFIITASTMGGSSQPGTYRLRTILPGESCASVWPMFRCNYSNTAANSEIFTESLIEAWTAPFQTGDDILSSPAVTGDKIFIGSKDKYIYAIDRETGTELWKHFTANYTYPSPAVSDGVVYTGSYSAYVFALNEETGAEYWKTQIVGGIFASPIVKDNVLYVGTTGGKIYAFDVTNVKQGIVTQKWAAPYDTPNTAGTFSTPALRDGVLYVGTTGGPVVALDAETGQELWSANTANNAWSSPAVAYGKVFAGSWSSKVYAFDKYTGAEIWAFDTDGWIYSSPAVAYGKVYIGSNDGNVYALNEHDGSLAWPQPFLTGGAVQSSPVVSNGRVVVGSADGNLYILDAHTGQLLNSISVGDQVYSSPSIVDGHLYFGSYDNKLYAFKPGQDQDPPVISNLTVDPTAISPAIGGTARITADVTDAGSFGWTLLVREQNSSNDIQIAYGADSNIDVTWDGKVNGSPMQDGIYTVIIRAQDFTPNANQSEIIANNALNVDSAAPVTAILSPAANAFIGNSVTVIITAEDPQPGTGIAEVTVWAEGGAPVLAQLSGNPNEYRANLDLQQLAQGSLAIFVQAKDILGNARTQSVTAIHDHTPPQIIVSYPAQNPYATFVTQQFINASVGDALSGLKSFTCVIPNNTCNIQVINQASRYITFSAPLIQGQNTVTLTAEDKAGNTTALDVVFIIDTTPPVISQLNPAHQSYLNDPQASGSAMIEDPESGINPGSIVVTLNGSLVSHSFDTVTGSLTFTPPPALSDGQYDLTVRAANAVGKETSVTHRYYLDTVAPAGPMNPQAWPQEGVAGEFDGDGTVFLTWEAAQDDNGGSGVAGYFAGIGGSTDFIDAANPLKHQTTTTQTGLVSYCVHAVDKAGNVSGTECDTISVAASGLVAGEITDSPDPISPKNIGTQPTNDSSTIQARIFGQGLTSWTVEIYGPDAPSVPVIVLPVPGPGVSDSVSVEWDGKNSSGQFVDDGTYTYRIVPQGTNPEPPIIGQGTVTVDNTYPESLIVNLTDGAKLTETSYTVEVRVIENVAVESVRLIVDGSERTPCAFDHTDTGGNPVYACLWAVSQEGAGWHTVAARVTDTARNTKDSPSLNIQKPMMPVPEVTITSPAPDAPVRGQSVVTVHFSLKQGNVRKLDLFISADGTNYTPAAPAFNLSKPYPSSGDHSFTIDTTAYSDGFYYVKAEAHKSASQSAESAPVRILIDNTRASVSDFIPGKGTRISPQSTPVNVIVTASVSDTGSGVSHATLSVNGGPDLPVQIKDIFGTLKVVKQLLNQSYGNYALVLKVYDKVGNVTLVDDWTFVIAPKPVIHSICPISGPPGSTVTITGENFSGDISSLKVMAGYISMPGPVMDFEQASIISMDQSTIVAQLPQGLRVSDPYAEFGLARIYVDAGGQQTMSKLFQITENPLNARNLIYVAGSHAVYAIDPYDGIVATIKDALNLGNGADVAVNDDASYLFVAGYDSNHTTIETALNVIDTACHSVVSHVNNVSAVELLYGPDNMLYSLDPEYGSFLIDPVNAVYAPSDAIERYVSHRLGLDSEFGMDAATLFTSRIAHYEYDYVKLFSNTENSIINRITIPSFNFTQDSTSVLSLTPDGKYLIGGWSQYGNSYLINVFDLGSNSRISSLSFDNNINSLSVDPTNTLVVAVTGNNDISFISLKELISGQSGKAVLFSTTNSQNVRDTQFSSDGRALYILDEGSLKIIDIEQSVTMGSVIVSRQHSVSGYHLSSAPPGAPFITSISNSHASVEATVKLNGIRFNENSELNIVMVGGVRAQVLESTETEIVFVVPAQATSGDIYVAVLGRKSNSLPFSVSSPVITAIDPEIVIPGAGVVVVGEGFSADPNMNQVFFNDLQATVTFSSTGALTVKVPDKADPGKLHVSVYGKESNRLDYDVDRPDLRITSHSTSQKLTIADDIDGSTINGIQITIVAESSNIADGSLIQLLINDRLVASHTMLSGRVAFSNVTVFPEHTKIAVVHQGGSLSLYSADTILVAVDMPTGNSDKVVTMCVGDCGAGYPDTHYQLYIYDMATNTLAPIGNTDNGTAPSWSPEGDKVAFSKSVIDISDPNIISTTWQTDQNELHVVNLQDEFAYPIRNLITQSAVIGNIPVWSPDGSKIAYVTKCGLNEACVNVAQVTPGGHFISDPVEIDRNIALPIVWSPNGNFLVLSKADLFGGMRTLWGIPDRNNVLNNCAVSESGDAISCNAFLSEGFQTVSFAADGMSPDKGIVKSRSFWVDRTPPDLLLKYPSEVLETYDPVLLLHGTASDITGISSVLVNGQEMALRDEMFYGSVALSPGINTLTVEAIDGAGHISATQKQVTLLSPDTDGPSIDSVSIGHGQVYSMSPIQLNIEINSPQYVINTFSVDVFIDNVDIFNTCSNLLSSDGLRLEIDCVIEAEEGRHKIHIQARDQANNVTIPYITYFYIDGSLPHLLVRSHQPMQIVKDASIDLFGDIEDDFTGIANMTVNGIQATVKGTSWLASNVSMTEGLNDISIVVTDKAGNILTVNHSLLYVPEDVDGLSLNITEPVSGDLLENEQIIVSASINDQVDMMSVIAFTWGSQVEQPYKVSEMSALKALDWSPGFPGYLTSLWNIIKYVDVNTEISLPVFEQSEIAHNTLIYEITAQGSGHNLVYTTLDQSYRTEAFLVNLETRQRKSLGGNIYSPDWLVPQQPVYNSTPPVISNISPRDKTYVASTNPSIIVEASDDTDPYLCGITSWSFTVNDIDMTNSAAYNPINSTFTISTDGLKLLFGDTVSYRLQVWDCVGNGSSVAQGHFRIGYPPRIDDLNPANNGATKDETVHLSASFAGVSEHGALSGRFVVDGVELSAIFDSDKSQVYADVYLDEGYHNASAVIVDEIGFEVRKDWMFIVDRTAPSISDVYPSTINHFNDVMPNCRAAVDDGRNGSGIDPSAASTYVTLYANEQQSEHSLTFITSDSSYSSGKLYFAPPDLSDGQAIAIAQVSDRAGNSAVFKWLINIDKTAAEIIILQPLPESVSTIPIHAIQVTADIDWEDEVVFKVDGKECYWQRPYVNLLECPVNIMVPTSGRETHNATVTITDSAGNVTEAAWPFIVASELQSGDMSAPSINDFSIAPRFIDPMQSEIAKITYTLTENSFVTLLIEKLDGELTPLGTKITLLDKEPQTAGVHSVQWDGNAGGAANTATPGPYRVSLKARLNDASCNPNCLTYTLPDLRTSEYELKEFSNELELHLLSNKRVPISYDVNSPSLVSGIIGKINGPVNLKFIDDLPIDSGHHTTYWDGRVEEGLFITESTYDFALIFRPLMMNSIVIEEARPQLTSFPEKEFFINPHSGNPVQISIGYSHPVTVEASIYSVNNELVRDLGTYPISTNHTIAWDGFNNDMQRAADGVYQISLSANSLIGSHADDVHVTVQVISPTVKLLDGKVIVIGNPGDTISDLREDGLPMFFIESQTGSGLPVVTAYTDQTTGVHNYSFVIENDDMGIPAYMHNSIIDFD